jgi:hypothetical protein
MGLGLGFGPRVLAGSLWPFTAGAMYRGSGFGFFFGSGRAFWAPDGATVGHYLGTARGWWLAASLVLIGAAGMAGLRALVGRRPMGESGQVVLTCAVLHLVFVSLLFGNALSWPYYAYLLVLGLASLGAAGHRTMTAVVVGLALAALVVDRTLPREVADTWRSEAGSRPTFEGLWASPELADEWRQVRRIVDARGRRAALVAFSGAAACREPSRFLPPVGMFLMPGMEGSIEARRVAAQARVSGLAVRVLDPLLPYDGAAFIAASPALRDALGGMREVWRGRYFTVVEGPAGDTGGPDDASVPLPDSRLRPPPRGRSRAVGGGVSGTRISSEWMRKMPGRLSG